MHIAITNEDDTIYQVSKFSNDEGFIKFFVYNNGCKKSEKYGHFLLITTDGVFIQYENFDVVKTSLKEAVKFICEDDCIDSALMILTGILSSVLSKSDSKSF